MGVNWCEKCFGKSLEPGRIPDPDRRWWQFWKTVPCNACGGDGYAKPPGWPDRDEMERLRPSLPPPPPKVCSTCSCESKSSSEVTIHDARKWLRSPIPCPECQGKSECRMRALGREVAQRREKAVMDVVFGGGCDGQPETDSPA